MKTKFAWLAVVALLLNAPAARAAEAESLMSLGIVDVSEVLQTADAAKSILTALEAKREEFRKEITKEEDSLRAADKEAAKQKATLSQDDFDKKRKEFEQKYVNAQKMAQEREMTLLHARNDALLKLRGEMGKIVEAIAKEKNLAAVLTREAVILNASEMDITAEVIGRLNKSVKKIPVDWAAAKAASGKKSG